MYGVIVTRSKSAGARVHVCVRVRVRACARVLRACVECACEEPQLPPGYLTRGGGERRLQLSNPLVSNVCLPGSFDVGARDGHSALLYATTQLPVGTLQMPSTV